MGGERGELGLVNLVGFVPLWSFFEEDVMDGRSMEEFVTPLKKLARFFQKSRDSWKEKHQNLKSQLKLCQNQTRAVEKSREHWREQARAAQGELQELKKQLNKKSR
jgi:chromosome segregation ATPase